MSEARRLLERAVRGRYDDDSWWHEARAYLAQPVTTCEGSLYKAAQDCLAEAAAICHTTTSDGKGGTIPCSEMPNEWRLEFCPACVRDAALGKKG